MENDPWTLTICVQLPSPTVGSIHANELRIVVSDGIEIWKMKCLPRFRVLVTGIDSIDTY
jgi:hypothetical protein